MPNLLPLDSFRQTLGYNPWHWWGLSNSGDVPVDSACNTLLQEYAWQDADGVGRSEIREAIENAEKILTDYLGYAPAPHYVTEEIHDYPRFLDRELWRMNSYDGSGRWASVRLREGHIWAVGIEARTLIGTAVRSTPPVGGDTLVFSDADGDSLYETFTITLPTTQTDVSKVAVYFAAADRLDSAAVGERWRIEPVSVTISGGNVVIKGRAWLLVKPLKYEGAVSFPTSLDPDTLTNFAASLEVYTRETNQAGTTTATSQAELIWESHPWPAWATCCASPASSGLVSTDPAAEAYAIARVGVRDARNGIVIPGMAAYNAATAVWSAADWGTCRPPDRVLVRYCAGFAREDNQMARKFQTIVARLAAAELARPICGCETANRELYRWQVDLARTGGNNDDQYGAVSANDLDNPFGTRRGHIYAWRQARNLRLVRGVVA